MKSGTKIKVNLSGIKTCSSSSDVNGSVYTNEQINNITMLVNFWTVIILSVKQP